MHISFPGGVSPLKRNSPPSSRASAPGTSNAPTDSFERSLDPARDRDYSQQRTLRNLALATIAAVPATLSAFSPAAAAETAVVVEQTLETPQNVDLAANELQVPGTLILSDFFDQRQGLSHGQVVEGSSRDVGFQNNIIKRETPVLQAMKKAKKYYSRLDARSFTPEGARKFTYDFLVNQQLGSLQSATQELHTLREAGATNSVLNLSRGWGKAQMMESLYTRTQMAWDSSAHPQAKTVGEKRLRKIAPGLGLDAQAILDGAPGARAEYQKRLLSLLDEAGADERLAQAQADYDQAVRDFEAQRNSVVVAAANSGEILQLMERDAPTPELSEDFWRNRLASDEVTTVGATRELSGEEQVAGYTNYDPGIDVYADGQLDGAAGTSFATPRIGSVMAELHRRNPEATSAEVEAMLTKDFSHQLRDYKGWAEAPALNEAAAQQWLSGQ